MAGVDELVGFGIADYTVFVLVLGVSTGIGFFFAFRGNKDPEDFLMGGRSMSVLPVSLSLLSSFISSISILGYSGETYGHGIQVAVILLGSLLGVFLAMVLFLPVFYPLKLTSINEYIEMRFQSKVLRLLVLFVTVFSMKLYLGLCLYAPTLALSSLTPISIDNYIVILGVICTFYSTMGGLKAVVWTDTFQMSIMMLGLIAVIAIGSARVGGIANVWAIASKHNRTEMFDFNFNMYQRHNFWNVFMMGTTLFFSMYGTNQMNLQRACSVPSLKDAIKVYMINLLGMIVTLTLVFLSGLCAFANYAGCDPITRGAIFTKDQILPYFVMDKIGAYGMAGLCVATLLSGTLSSLSSVINSMAAMVWSELSERVPYFRRMSEWKAALFNRILSCAVGGIMMGLAFVCKGFSGILQAAFTIMGVMSGPCLAIFTIGLLFPHVGKKGATCGMIGSMAIMAWIIIGAKQYISAPELLPLSVDQCNLTNNSTFDITESSYLNEMDEMYTTPIYHKGLLQKSNVSSTNNLGFQNVENGNVGVEVTTTNYQSGGDGNIDEWPLMYVYGISYTLYTTVGAVVSILIAILVTGITGSQDLTQVKPELIAPISRIFLPRKLKQAAPRRVSYTPIAQRDPRDFKEDFRGNLTIPPPHMVRRMDTDHGTYKTNNHI